MLAVLMSMKPEWWEKILDGEKTLEIRKTHPQNERLEWPVTVLVYVSGTGAVQGQFLCPGEVSYRTMQDLEEMSCVPREDLLKYAKGRRISGWIVLFPCMVAIRYSRVSMAASGTSAPAFLMAV